MSRKNRFKKQKKTKLKQSLKDFGNKKEKIETALEYGVNKKKKDETEVEFENIELKENLHLKYSDFCNKYRDINGFPSKPYFIDGHKTENITKSGYEIHHIGENIIPDLSKKCWSHYSDFQSPDMLVYLTPLQHTIAHILIVLEGPFYMRMDRDILGLGAGGLLKHGMLKRAFQTLSTSDSEKLIRLLATKIRNIKSLLEEVELKSHTERIIPEIIDEYHILLENTINNQDNFFTPSQWEQLGLRNHYANRNYTRIVRRKDNILMVYSINKEKKYLLWCGTQGHIKKIDALPDFNEMLFILEAYKWFCNLLNQILQPISQTVQSLGGKGIIHGCIVDFDFFNHIYVDFANKILVPYKTGITAYEHLTYENFYQMLIDTPTYSHTNSLALQSMINNSLIPQVAGGLTSLTKEQKTMTETHDYVADIYNRNMKIFRIQKSVETNTIQIIEPFVIDAYKSFCENGNYIRLLE